MKKRIVCGLLAAMAVMSGCAAGPELLKASSIGTRSDVFRELPDGGAVPREYADLRIISSLKTHKPGIYSQRDPHGTAEFRLLLNIDGQVTTVAGRLQKENTEPRGLMDPEAGEGIRYIFRKDLRLKAGTHRIVVAIAEDGVVVDREITLAGGSVNDLVLEPVYGTTEVRRLPTTYSETSYLEGIRGIRGILNGKPI